MKKDAYIKRKYHVQHFLESCVGGAHYERGSGGHSEAKCFTGFIVHDKDQPGTTTTHVYKRKDLRMRIIQ